jgi:hypothetical protein
MPYYRSAICHTKVTDYPAIFRLIEAQKKMIGLGELRSWSLADVVGDIEAMPWTKAKIGNIVAAVKKNAIDGKILCGFEVCMFYDVNALL